VTKTREETTMFDIDLLIGGEDVKTTGGESIG